MAVSAHPGAASATDAPQLEFSVEHAHAVPYAAVPTLGFALRIERPDGGEVRSVALNAQLRIAAAGRSYSSAEQERLFELFGRPEQFAKTVRSLLWTNASANVPAFRGSTVHELTIPCTYDFEVAAAKYLEALEGGEVPLELLFSGGVFYPGPGGRLQVASISWDREAEYRLPVAVWREAMREHFGDSPWLRPGRAMPSAVDPVRAIADAVLYEGYVLWPYRRSATKNRQRWTFGGIYPRSHSEGREDDPWTMQTECLLEGDAATRVDVRVRFLQVVERQVLAGTEGALVPVDELVVDEDLLLSWDEAREREVAVPDVRPAELDPPRVVAANFAAGEEEEEVVDATGARVGAISRRWRALEGSVEVTCTRLGADLFRIHVHIENTTPWAGADREDALRQTFASAHTVLRADGGGFVSLADPPEGFRGEAEACRNEGTWPVPVGERGDRGTILSSPIILEDYPRIAPESPGDLFDGGEIDGLLTLSILGLSDEEKREMRATDPRTREILERTEALSPEELMQLHGRVRELHAVRRP